MLFTSIDFACFLVVIFLAYWFVFGRNLRLQNAFVAIASYVFYGWWDARFLSLILFSTLVDYLVGIQLAKSGPEKNRKLLVGLSLIVNLGLLGFFKYYNFFLENFITAFTFFGQPIEASSLNIILPVGISFYTFQTLSYTLDVYRGKMSPNRDFISFAAYVSFFPQLVAGPIERASNLLPQFNQERKFDYHQAVDGLRQILWGFFKKMVIADNCAEYANLIFNYHEDYSGSTLFLGAIFFTFQIYGDFSGYSDIAIGTARLFGFNLMQNFAFPYFSRDIAEFWRRWHISLSTWFRDYLYIPLGGSRGNTWVRIRNTMIVFVVSGFWHGANWTFIFWGFLNALFFLPLLLTSRNRKNLDHVAENRLLPSFRELVGMATTFLMTVFAWIFFRAENMSHAFAYLQGMFSRDLLSIPQLRPTYLLLLIAGFLVVEWLGRKDQYGLEKLGFTWPKALRLGMYYVIIGLIFYFAGNQQDFIYFQF